MKTQDTQTPESTTEPVDPCSLFVKGNDVLNALNETLVGMQERKDHYSKLLSEMSYDPSCGYKVEDKLVTELTYTELLNTMHVLIYGFARTPSMKSQPYQNVFFSSMIYVIDALIQDTTARVVEKEKVMESYEDALSQEVRISDVHGAKSQMVDKDELEHRKNRGMAGENLVTKKKKPFILDWSPLIGHNIVRMSVTAKGKCQLRHVSGSVSRVNAKDEGNPPLTETQINGLLSQANGKFEEFVIPDKEYESIIRFVLYYLMPLANATSDFCTFNDSSKDTVLWVVKNFHLTIHYSDLSPSQRQILEKEVSDARSFLIKKLSKKQK